MIVRILKALELPGWQLTLENANYRPERRYVQVARTDDSVAWCVGFSDDPAQADMLFDAVVRTVRILTTGESDSADWAEIPDGEWLD